jgi:pimeloyl-ACP methyl ester carboxylesterase
MKINPLLYSLIIILATNCSDDDNFFLRNEKADMKVHITGNKASNVFIIFLHGGPGNGSYIWEGFFGAIEDEFAVVYWDQRAAGSAQGNAQPESMTIDQFIEDTHKLILLINELNNSPVIFLMGHSWGGLLGTKYLINFPDNIKGWIEVDGAHNKILGSELSREWVMNYAQNQINSGKDIEYWQEALDWYISYTGKLTYSSKHYMEYLDKAHAYFYKSEYSFYNLSDFFFGSPNGFDLILNAGYSDKNMEDEIILTDLTTEMYKIRIPSLICWGKHDGAIPFQMAQDAYDALGTVPADKSIVYFEESAHSPMIEETDEFNRIVIEFVTRYR